MRIIIKEGESMVADLSFTEEEDIAVGSEPDCNVQLVHPEISGRQLLISPTEGGQWLIENLDPDTKVLINDRALTERTTLSHDDEIVINDYHLEIYLQDEKEEVLDAEPEVSAEELAKIRQYPLPAGSLVRLQSDALSLDRSQLYRLSEATLPLDRCIDLPGLVDAAVDITLSLFDARCAWIGLRRKARGELDVQGGKLASGQTTDVNAIIELLLYRCVTRRQHVLIRRVRDHSLIATAAGVPLVSRLGTLGMIYVDRAQRAPRLRSSDLDLLSALSTHFVAKAEELMHGQARRTAELSAAEIGVVHQIQAHLDPKVSANFGRLRTAAYSRSGQHNPGDVYDVMPHPDTNITAFMLGHVNGTGALLALSMARLHSTFRVGFLHNDPPHALARTLNWLMHTEKDPTNVDAVFLLIDPPSGKFKYARGGKIGAFIVDSNGQPRALTGADAPAIGTQRTYQYESNMGQLADGETLVLYTRGVASCLDAEGNRFGEHRFIELVCDGFCQPPTTTIQDVTDEIVSFCGGTPQSDDMSIVLLNRSAG